jgi:DNA polymerase-3 subunit gamma/tau
MLYKKYRPASLEEIKGNAPVVQALSKMLATTEKVPHAILLHGGTGCGKTTIGRIIKNHLDVHDQDFAEINSSNNRGIDTIRELTKNSRFKPLKSPFRIYLIDECHKMTNDAQNAFLKDLEDTPEHVIYILCTTEPKKVISAIRGRCQIFELKPLENNQMKRLLKGILRKEKESLDDAVMSQIMESSEGHPRNAIQLLENVLSVDEDKRLEAAKSIEDNKAESIELARLLIKMSNWKSVCRVLSNLKGNTEAESVRRVVLGYCQAILLKGDSENAGIIMEHFIDPFYDTGFPQLVYACYCVIKGE